MLVHGCNECVRQLSSLILATALLGLVLSGCSSSPLRRGLKHNSTEWKSFDEAKEAFPPIKLAFTPPHPNVKQEPTRTRKWMEHY